MNEREFREKVRILAVACVDFLGSVDPDPHRLQSAIASLTDEDAPPVSMSYQPVQTTPLRGPRPKKVGEAEPLTDGDPMPFGKFKGTPLGEVEQGYLIWLWKNGIKDDSTDRMHVYIRDRFPILAIPVGGVPPSPQPDVADDIPF